MASKLPPEVAAQAAADPVEDDEEVEEVMNEISDVSFTVIDFLSNNNYEDAMEAANTILAKTQAVITFIESKQKA